MGVGAPASFTVYRGPWEACIKGCVAIESGHARILEASCDEGACTVQIEADRITLVALREGPIHLRPKADNDGDEYQDGWALEAHVGTHFSALEFDAWAFAPKTAGASFLPGTAFSVAGELRDANDQPLNAVVAAPLLSGDAVERAPDNEGLGGPATAYRAARPGVSVLTFESGTRREELRVTVADPARAVRASVGVVDEKGRCGPGVSEISEARYGTLRVCAEILLDDETIAYGGTPYVNILGAENVYTVSHGGKAAFYFVGPTKGELKVQAGSIPASVPFHI